MIKTWYNLNRNAKKPASYKSLNIIIKGEKISLKNIEFLNVVHHNHLLIIIVRYTTN